MRQFDGGMLYHRGIPEEAWDVAEREGGASGIRDDDEAEAVGALLPRPSGISYSAAVLTINEPVLVYREY